MLNLDEVWRRSFLTTGPVVGYLFFASRGVCGGAPAAPAAFPFGTAAESPPLESPIESVLEVVEIAGVMEAAEKKTQPKLALV